MIIGRSLYGLKRSGATWMAKLAKNLISLGYKLSEANDDVYMKRDFKPNGVPYYKLMICYVDDLLYI